MKRVFFILAMALTTLTASAQFEQGKAYLGASLTGLDLSYSGNTKLHFGVEAKAGYFFWDNIMGYGEMAYQHSGADGIGDFFTIGAGGRYYIIQNGLFLGANAKYVHASHYDDFMPGVEVGYAFFINRTVTIEPAIYYDQSFKRHSDYSTVGLRLGIGINLFKDSYQLK